MHYYYYYYLLLLLQKQIIVTRSRQNVAGATLQSSKCDADAPSTAPERSRCWLVSNELKLLKAPPEKNRLQLLAKRHK